MPKEINFENSLLYHWIKNLVGTSISFSFNLFITLSAGLVYSFKLIPSPYLLLLFGVISPILFTLCLYSSIRNSSGALLNEPFPKVFMSRTQNHLLMSFDICLIIGFALFIYTGPLNYFLFRFLQTVFFPSMLLVLLRVLFVSSVLEKHEDENEEMG